MQSIIIRAYNFSLVLGERARGVANLSVHVRVLMHAPPAQHVYAGVLLLITAVLYYEPKRLCNFCYWTGVTSKVRYAFYSSWPQNTVAINNYS